MILFKHPVRLGGLRSCIRSTVSVSSSVGRQPRTTTTLQQGIHTSPTLSRKMSPSAANGATPRAETDGKAAAFADPGIVPNPNTFVKGPWSVDKVLDKIGNSRPIEGSSSPIPYFHLLERLKTMKREGWRRFGIARGESIADHMYRMAMMSQLAPVGLRERLDLYKCMRMCLIHDMAESLVGDITPVDGVPKPEKSRREADTMDYISKQLLGGVGDGLVGADIRAIWQEYEDSETLDSIYVHDIDKLELLTQMNEYEQRAGGKLDLGEFAYVASKIVLPETRAWGQELLKDREAFWAKRKHVNGEVGVAGGVPAEHKSAQDEYYGTRGEEGSKA